MPVWIVELAIQNESKEGTHASDSLRSFVEFTLQSGHSTKEKGDGNYKEPLEKVCR
jgi:hypothetical protein